MSLKKSFSAPCYKAFCRRNQSQSSQRCSLTSCFNDTGGKCYLKKNLHFPSIFYSFICYCRDISRTEAFLPSFQPNGTMFGCQQSACCFMLVFTNKLDSLDTGNNHPLVSYCTQLPAALNSFSLSVGKSLKLIQRFRLSSEVVPHVIKYPHLHKNAA